MQKLLFLLPFILLFQNCQKDNIKATDRFDHQYLYNRWEQIDYNPATGVKSYQPYTDSEFSFEFKENGEAIYRYPQLLCGYPPLQDWCKNNPDSLKMRFETFGTINQDIDVDIFQVSLPEIRYSSKWKILALDANKLSVIEQ